MIYYINNIYILFLLVSIYNSYCILYMNIICVNVYVYIYICVFKQVSKMGHVAPEDLCVYAIIEWVETGPKVNPDNPCHKYSTKLYFKRHCDQQLMCWDSPLCTWTYHNLGIIINFQQQKKHGVSYNICGL